jgi:hypothetical protein
MDSLKVHIINLDNAHDRFEHTIAPLRAMPGLDVRRFPAQRPDRKADGLTTLSSVAPDKTLAIALSHRAVAAEVARDGSSPALVLEDDVYPLVDNLRPAIDECIARAKPGWDVMLLNTAGPNCNVCEDERPGRLCGSAAAYMLSPDGARKLATAAISWHADIVRNSDAYDVRRGPELFGTDDAEPSGVVVGGRDVLWFARQPCFRWRKGAAVPTWTVVVLIALAILGLGTSVLLSVQGRGCASVSMGVPSATVLGGITALIWHTSRDANYARCSRESLGLLTVVLAAMVLLASANLARGYLPALSAFSLFGALVALFLVGLWWDERRTTG